MARAGRGKALEGIFHLRASPPTFTELCVCMPPENELYFISCG